MLEMRSVDWELEFSFAGHYCVASLGYQGEAGFWTGPGWSFRGWAEPPGAQTLSLHSAELPHRPASLPRILEEPCEACWGRGPLSLTQQGRSKKFKVNGMVTTHILDDHL